MAANQKKFLLTPIIDADGIAQSQTPAAGGVQALTLNGALASSGSVTFATAHQIRITSAADDSGRAFYIVGIDSRGLARTEAVVGANAGTATSVHYFVRVDNILVDANTAGAVTVGVNGVSVSPWYVTDLRVETFSLGFSVELSAGAGLTYSVEHTMDNLQSLTETITTIPHADIAGETTTLDGNYAYPCRGVRCRVTAYTSGTLEMNIIQSR